MEKSWLYIQRYTAYRKWYMLDKNAFGELVRSYRKQHGWTQEELADRWGYSSMYVSQIEQGRRKLSSAAQLVKLADILEIPSEKLEAIGRGIPERKKKMGSKDDRDSEVLQMLLAQGKDKVRLAYMVWLADQHPIIESSLRDLTFNLEQYLTSYRGEFMKPAKQLLAYTHQMQGKIAYDRLDYAAGGGHFSTMLELGEELNDPDIITLGMVHQGTTFKKRGLYDKAFGCFKAAKPFSDAASANIQGIRYNLMARSYYDFGDEQGFLRAINSALDIATHTQESISSLANEFSLDTVLCEQASGFSELEQPEKALEIYKKTDLLRPFRPLREKGSYIINKAQAYLHNGSVKTKQEPSPTSLSTLMRPPCASTICLTIASPRPVPPVVRVREGSAR
jgi:transcriptional regulator with XRE-family HTH domain